MEAGPAPRGGCRGVWIFPIDMLAPPINKLTLLKAATFVLNFKLAPPPLINAWPPKSTALPPALSGGIQPVLPDRFTDII